MKHVRLLNPGGNGTDLKENLEKMTTVQRNSFLHIRNWVKGEIYSLEALIDAINYKDQVTAR